MEFKIEEVKTKYSKFSIDLKYYKYKWISPPRTPLGPNWDFKPVCMSETHSQYINLIRDFEIRPDDVFVLGFPKSGTSWLQEMIWLISNDFNYAKASKTSQLFRFPLLELASLLPSDQALSVLMNEVNLLPSPRFIKSHLPVSMLPEQLWSVKPKLIHIQRNSKDAAVSLYHHYKNMQGYLGTKDEFFNLYLEGNVFYGPVVNHINEFEHLRSESNILFLTYEEMKRDLKTVIRKTAKFLNKNVTTQQIDELYEYLQPESMRKNNACNQEDLVFLSSSVFQSDYDPNFNFIRKAKAESFKEEMSDQFVTMFEQHIEKKIGKLSLSDTILTEPTPSKGR
uniref:CSON006016 protein n=1 Tax=Culicoides sonorensis TaxID=179676 RepID=A0A336LJX9_CULSO